MSRADGILEKSVDEGRKIINLGLGDKAVIEDGGLTLVSKAPDGEREQVVLDAKQTKKLITALTSKKDKK